MDDDNVMANNGSVSGHTNGVLEGTVMDKVDSVGNGMKNIHVDERSEDTQEERSEAVQSSTAEIEGKRYSISKESGTKDSEQASHNRSQKEQEKSQNPSFRKDKSSSPRHTAGTWVKKKKDGKQGEDNPVSVDPATSTSRPKQSFAFATNRRSFNSREQDGRKESADSCSSTTHPTKKSASATFDGSNSEDSNEQVKDFKPLKTGALVKAKEHSDSLSPTEGSSKPLRIGTTPSYSFNFRCNERAEKRKEFFSKLEEKVNAKELEKSNMQAKSKETQEAEIKLFRKSLTFKATPMPSFYLEPAPPKVELKKIPPTRAKSPKFGRQKNPPTTAPEATEAKSNKTSRSDRMSLDENSSQNGTAKVTTSHVKKPQRKSLPRLPSQKNSLSNSMEQPPSEENEQNDQNLEADVTLEAEETDTESYPTGSPEIEEQESSVKADDAPIESVQ
ncbi:protein WVD2-like 5 [Aristolochia californica]|uniref:protein WVD2-like 5 n=1 Tax=Aristolochia californica TaxID=171875 RepID=UPI0035E2DC35